MIGSVTIDAAIHCTRKTLLIKFHLVLRGLFLSVLRGIKLYLAIIWTLFSDDYKL